MKSKPGKIKDVLVYFKYSTLVFFLFTPLAMLLKAISIKGGFGLFLNFLLVSLLFAYNMLRGMNLIYDIENSDSIKLLVFSSSFLFAIPLILSWFFFAFVLMLVR